MKIEDIPIGSKIDILERDGFEAAECKVIGIEDGCLIVSFSNAMTKGKFRIPKRSCSVSVTLTTKGNSLDMYKLRKEKAEKLARS